MDFHQCVVNTMQKTLHLKGLAVPMRTATNCAQSSLHMLMSSHVVMLSWDVLKNAIDTDNHPPIHRPACRVPPFRRKEVQKLLQDMERCDMIQPTSSPWASPVVLEGWVTAALYQLPQAEWHYAQRC